MPTYEYRCARGHEFERVQKITAKPIGKCPICGAKAERLISGGQGLIFKGSGFYITDYARAGKTPPNESGSTSESGDKAAARSDAASGGSGTDGAGATPKKKSSKADVA
jgi:putative FmdB family regulatory protein